LRGHSSGSSVGVVLHRLQTAWRNWRERRRQYQTERALYKLAGSPGVREAWRSSLRIKDDSGELTDLGGGDIRDGGVNPPGT